MATSFDDWCEQADGYPGGWRAAFNSYAWGGGWGGGFIYVVLSWYTTTETEIRAQLPFPPSYDGISHYSYIPPKEVVKYWWALYFLLEDGSDMPFFWGGYKKANRLTNWLTASSFEAIYRNPETSKQLWRRPRI